MTSAFEKLKASRMSFEDLANRVEGAMEGKSSTPREKDERFYYPATNEQRAGEAVLRLLPGTDPSKGQFVTVYSHGYEGSNGWYIHECPTTLGIKSVKCPQCMANQARYKEFGGYESSPKYVKDEVRPRNRRTQYITNVLVVSDPANPENEGKVFLFKFGKKIMAQYKEALKPSFASTKPLDPWSIFDDGANWNMRIRRVDDNANYDASSFDMPAQIAGTEAEINAVLEAQYSLDEFVDPEKFESFDSLQKSVNEANGIESSPTQNIPSATAPQASTTVAQQSAPVQEAAPTVTAQPKLAESDSTDADDALSYFDKVLNGNE